MHRHPTGRAERLVTLDIETVPDRTLLPPDWGNKFAKAIHQRIACISFVEAEIAIDADGCERYAVTSCRSGGETDWDEKRLLETFWAFFARRPTRIVTWNGRMFDIPALLQRSMIHGVTAQGWYTSNPRHGYTYRYASDWHCDLMDVLSDHGACQKLALDDAAVAIGLPGKIGGHGSRVEAMVAAGEIEQVRRYCEVDVLNLHGLYIRHGLLTGRISKAGYDASVASLARYLDQERALRPHLGEFRSRWRDIEGAVTSMGEMCVSSPRRLADLAEAGI